MLKIMLFHAGNSSTVKNMLSPPLGLLYLASVARRDGNHHVTIFDMNVEEGGVSAAVKALQDFNPSLVGISSVTVDSPIMHELATSIKKEVTSTIVLAGGPHPTAYTKETLANEDIDVAVIGEGEDTFSDLLEKIESGKDLADVPGIAFKKKGKLIQTIPRPNIKNVDKIPLPAWDLLNLKKYWTKNTFGRLGPRRYMSIFTSRACPFGCIYCHKLFGKGFRPRSAESVLNEMQTLIDQYKIKDFEIVDDCFNLDNNRVVSICDGILSKGWNVNLSFSSGLRADKLDYPLLEKMKRAGTKEISIAIETASPRLQKMIGKRLNFDKLIRTIEAADKLRIPCEGFFMLGFPTETETEMQETVRFAIESKLLYAQFFIVTPFKGTEMEKLFNELVEPHQKDLKSLDFDKGYHHNLSNLSAKKIERIQIEANRKFYMNPIRIAKILILTHQKSRIPKLGLKFLKNKIVGKFPL